MVKTFKIISWLEGISYILLLFIATPLKYLADNETYVELLGMPHGLLFVAYIIFAFLLKDKFNWRLKTFLIVCVLAIVPFGAFYVHRFLKEEG